MSDESSARRPPSRPTRDPLDMLGDLFAEQGARAAEIVRTVRQVRETGNTSLWTKQAALTVRKAPTLLVGLLIELAEGHREIAENELAIVAMRETIRIETQWHEDALASASAMLDAHFATMEETRRILLDLLDVARAGREVDLYRSLSKSLSALNRVSPDEWTRIFREEYQTAMNCRAAAWEAD